MRGDASTLSAADELPRKRLGAASEGERERTSPIETISSERVGMRAGLSARAQDPR
jgi:hypothetical protein